MAPLEYYIANGGTNQPPMSEDPDDGTPTVPDGYACTPPTPDAYTLAQIIGEEDVDKEYIIGRNWTFAPFSFKTQGFGNNVDPINLRSNAQVGIRWVASETVTTDPLNGCDTVTRTYGKWTLVSQTVEFVSVEGYPLDRVIFNNKLTNEDALLVLPPGEYGNTLVAVAPENYAYCGVETDTRLSYTGMFNEGEISYIPRICPSSQGAVKGAIPTSPFKPNEDVYPINALTAYSPDDRESVTATFRITTTYYGSSAGAQDNPATETITITLTATQNTEADYSDKIKGFTDMSYYEYDIQNVFTWPLDEPAFYQEDGTPIEPLQRYNERTGQTYDLRNNGLGFRGLTKEEDVPLPDLDPDDETYDVEATVATLEDLPLTAETGIIYQVTKAEVIFYDNTIPPAPEYSPSLYTNIREINTERGIETKVVETLTDTMYASDGGEETLWVNLTEDED